MARYKREETTNFIDVITGKTRIEIKDTKTGKVTEGYGDSKTQAEKDAQGKIQEEIRNNESSCYLTTALN